MPEPVKNEETTTPEPEPLDVRAIRHLVRLMKRYDLTAIDFVEGSTQIRLRRRGPETQVAYQPPPASYVPPPPQALPAAPQAPSTSVTTSAIKGIVIESPMVGTFYSSSSPDSPPFVNVGSAVRPDTTVCIIEAMKVFTDIPSGVVGTIAEVLVKSGQSVEFGQPLFRVNPA